MNDYIGLVAAAVSLAVAMATVSVLGPHLGMRLVSGRSAPIDGLRGYAAFFVFICHAAAWFYFVRTGRWSVTPLRAYGNLGTVSVVVFFMITAFLFTTKLLDSRNRTIDWLRMLVSRVMRLTPLYLFAMAALLLLVGVLSGFERSVAWPELLTSVPAWLGFTLAGAPDVNGVRDTWLIIAGVTWSLRYEIFFYLLLPALAVLTRAPAPAAWIALVCTVLALLVFAARLTPMLVAPFLGGMLAAWLVRVPRLREWALTSTASTLALVAFCGVIALSRGAFKLAPLALVSFAFFIVAAGNSLFGILSNRSARLLGEVSYSVYLLHAIFLFALVNWGVGLQRLASMSSTLYWLLIVCVTPALIALCMITFVWIEKPGIESTARISGSLRRLFERHAATTANKNRSV